MATAETVMAVYSEREGKALESRMRPKDSCPVWREGAGKVPHGNSPTPYSTARPVLCGGRSVMSVPTAIDTRPAAATRKNHNMQIAYAKAATAEPFGKRTVMS